MVDEQDEMLSLPVIGDLTYREWHGVVDGFYCGVRWGARQHDYDREKHYWRIGYMIGTAARYSLLAWLYAVSSEDKQ